MPIRLLPGSRRMSVICFCIPNNSHPGDLKELNDKKVLDFFMINNLYLFYDTTISDVLFFFDELVLVWCRRKS